jgi:hypothetical protein
LCFGVREEELKTGAFNNYRTCFGRNNIQHHRAEAVVQIWNCLVALFQTVQCYVNASEELKDMDHTWLHPQL